MARSRLLPGIAACVAVLSLSGCAFPLRLDASWYVVGNPQPEITPASFKRRPTEREVGIEDVYVALVNRGRHVKQIYSVGMTRNNTDLVIHNPPLEMDPGRVLILSMKQLSRSSGIESNCRIPIRLYFKTNSESWPRVVRIRGRMPSILPRDWINNCQHPPAEIDRAIAADRQ